MSRAALPLLALALVGTSLTACGGGGAETAAPEPAPEAAEQERVKDLANVLQLRRDFEADAGKARVLLLFSPT